MAASWYVAGDGKGKRDMVVLPYRDRLEVFSRYLQQLVMESLGKRLDRQGRVAHQGIAVYGNKGSTDQHAYVQQLRDGVDNFFATFIEVLEDPTEIPVLEDSLPGDFCLNAPLASTANWSISMRITSLVWRPAKKRQRQSLIYKSRWSSSLVMATLAACNRSLRSWVIQPIKRLSFSFFATSVAIHAAFRPVATGLIR